MTLPRSPSHHPLDPRQGARPRPAPGLAAADWWHRLPDGRIQCDLCPRECRLADGQSGFCHVRRVHRGSLVLASYARASGLCLDPIEKKPLAHFLPGTGTLSFGTAGCNLGCRFCQNWTLSKARTDEGLTVSAEPETIAEAAHQSGAASLAFTYNDPVVFAEYAIDCAAAAHAAGLRTVAVTAGYLHARPREAFFAPMDAANVDLKAFDETFYRRQCLGHLEAVLETLEWIHRRSRTWLEVTTLLIPGLNDSESELGRLCDWYLEHLGPDVPLHLTAFHPNHRLRDRGPTPAARVRMARELALHAGLRFVYTGNIPDAEGRTTACPGCGTAVIGRDGYRIRSWHLAADGRCRSCGSVIPGHFDAFPGTWEGRRLPLRLA